MMSSYDRQAIRSVANILQCVTFGEWIFDFFVLDAATADKYNNAIAKHSSSTCT
jgi:hypothetical protein